MTRALEQLWMHRRVAAPDGLLAALLLAFLATAGLFYVNIMPVLIEGLMEGLGFSAREAGLVGSANVYGAAAGALLVVPWVSRWPWRPAVVVLLVLLMAIDLASMLVTVPRLLTAVRALHGVAGGMLIGFAFALIARTLRPERAFGMLLLVQFGLGGLGVMFLPRLAARFGVEVLFGVLLAFSVVTLLMVPWLDAYPQRSAGGAGRHEARAALVSPRVPFALALAAVFLFQAANMALFSFIIGLARHFGLDAGFASTAVGTATWVGALGSAVAIALPARYGRLMPLLVALAITAGGILLLHGSASGTAFLIANCATGITWAFVMPYLFGACAQFDTGGRAAALAGFASKMGLASGPLAGALLLEGAGYERLIDLSAIGIVLCALAASLPAYRLDRRRAGDSHIGGASQHAAARPSVGD